MNEQKFYLCHIGTRQTEDLVLKFNRDHNPVESIKLVFCLDQQGVKQEVNKATGEYLLEQKQFALCFSLFSHKETLNLDILKFCTKEDATLLDDAFSNITWRVTFMRELVAYNPACAGYATGAILTKAGVHDRCCHEEKAWKVYQWLTSTGERKLLRKKSYRTTTTLSNNQPKATFKI